MSKPETDSEPTLRRRGLSACLAWSLIWPCLAFSLLGDAPLIPILAAGALLPAILFRRGMQASTRTAVYIVTASLLITVVLNEIYEIDSGRFFLEAGIVFPLLIAMGVGFCYVQQSARVVGVSLACALGAQLVLGTCLANPSNVRLVIPIDLLTPQLQAAIKDRYIIFITSMILQAGGVLMILVSEEQFTKCRKSNSTKTYVKGAFVMFGAQLLVFALGTGMVWGVQVMFPKLDALFSPMYTSYLRRQAGMRIFPEEANLNQTLNYKGDKKEDAVALFVNSKIPPGYLRGRVYHGYNRGAWRASKAETPATLSDLGGGISARQYNPRSLPVDELERVDVFTAGRFRTGVLLFPGNTDAIEIVADSLEQHPDGIFKPKGWDRAGGYSAYCSKIKQDASWPLPRQSPAPDYSAIQPDLLPELERHVQRLEIPPQASDLQRIRLTAQFLQNNYDYTLDRVKNLGKDPVLVFLEDTRKGHCELFASSAALLLRAQGIPTRYVTGFVCTETQGRDNWWVTRMADCHAWVEAWTEDQGWVLVEATPASGIPDGADRAGYLSGAWEAMQSFGSQLYAQVKRGYFADAVISILVAIWNVILWLCWSGPWYLGWAVIAIVVAATVLFVRRRRGRRAPTVAREHELAGITLMLEQYLARYGVRRGPADSLREAAEAARSAAVPRADEFTGLVYEYEGFRYSDSSPAEEVQQFVQKLKGWLRARA